MYVGMRGELDGWGACSCQLRMGPADEMLALRQGGRRPGVTVLVSDIPTVAALLKLQRGLCSLKTGGKFPAWSQTPWFRGLWRPGGGENSAGISKHAIVPTA